MEALSECGPMALMKPYSAEVLERVVAERLQLSRDAGLGETANERVCDGEAEDRGIDEKADTMRADQRSVASIRLPLKDLERDHHLVAASSGTGESDRITDG